MEIQRSLKYCVSYTYQGRPDDVSHSTIDQTVAILDTIKAAPECGRTVRVSIHYEKNYIHQDFIERTLNLSNPYLDTAVELAEMRDDLLGYETCNDGRP